MVKPSNVCEQHFRNTNLCCSQALSNWKSFRCGGKTGFWGAVGGTLGSAGRLHVQLVQLPIRLCKLADSVTATKMPIVTSRMVSSGCRDHITRSRECRKIQTGYLVSFVPYAPCRSACAGGSATHCHQPSQSRSRCPIIPDSSPRQACIQLIKTESKFATCPRWSLGIVSHRY